jgi:hypothetical protein
MAIHSNKILIQFWYIALYTIHNFRYFSRSTLNNYMQTLLQWSMSRQPAPTLAEQVSMGFHSNVMQQGALPPTSQQMQHNKERLDQNEEFREGINLISSHPSFLRFSERRVVMVNSHFEGGGQWWIKPKLKTSTGPHFFGIARDNYQ